MYAALKLASIYAAFVGGVAGTGLVSALTAIRAMVFAGVKFAIEFNIRT